MTGTERRNQIIERIRKNDVPVSGTMLAKEFEVSRQVIVQDIALIRAAGYDIISTHRGYLLNEPISVSRVFKVQHTDEQTEEELYSIVDLGGTVANVIVNHKVYGQMEAELNINSRKKAKDFIDDIKLVQYQSLASHKGRVLIYGVGASYIHKGDTLIYCDLACWEIQLRY